MVDIDGVSVYDSRLARMHMYHTQGNKAGKAINYRVLPVGSLPVGHHRWVTGVSLKLVS